MVVIWAQPKFNQSARIGKIPGLPAIIGLEARQRLLRSLVPLARRLTLHVVRPDQGSLDFAGANAIDLLLSVPLRCFAAVRMSLSLGAFGGIVMNDLRFVRTGAGRFRMALMLRCGMAFLFWLRLGETSHQQKTGN